MKKSLLTSLFFAVLATTAFATDNNTATTTATTQTTTTTAAPKPMSVSSLLLQLQKAGYLVTEVSYDKDSAKFKVNAIDRHGESQTLDLDAATGLTPDQRKVPHEISMAQAAKKVEKDDAYIKSIDYDSGNYKIDVVDKQGNESNVLVDPKTGKVTKS